MNRKLTVATVSVVSLSFFLGTAWAVQKAVKRSKFVDETYGYSIELPKFPGANPNSNATAFIVTGPPANGFAPNVNVTIQGISTTLKAYRDLSVAQFDQLGLKVNSEKERKVSGREAIEFDYEGKLPQADKAFRFLALAVVEKERIVLVTCTATPQTFPAVEAEFHACIDSMKFPEASP
jgi:hypothetical protein